MHFYSYGAQHYDDVDWGCVYRSFQNAQVATGHHVSTMPELLRIAHKRAGQWAEPAHFAHVYKYSHATIVGNAKPKFTRDSQYTHRHMSIDHLHAYIVHALKTRKSAFVVDDTISGFAIVYKNGRAWWVDPHFAQPRVTLLRDQLHRAKGWLILEVPHALY